MEEVGQAGLNPTDRALSVAGQNMYLAKVVRVNAEKYHVDVMSLGEGDEFFACRIAGRVFWMPQLDDIVIVAFLDDSLSNPIVLSKILLSKYDLVKSSDPEGIHGQHVIKDSDENVKASLEWLTDAEGNLTLKVEGLSGNLTIITDGVTKIDAPEIVLGSDGAHKILFGDELVKWLNSHTHVNGNAGSPTGTPIKPVLDKQVNSQKNRTD